MLLYRETAPILQEVLELRASTAPSCAVEENIFQLEQILVCRRRDESIHINTHNHLLMWLHQITSLLLEPEVG